MGKPNKKGGRVTPKKERVADPCRRRTQAYGRPMAHLLTEHRTTDRVTGVVKVRNVCNWCGKGWGWLDLTAEPEATSLVVAQDEGTEDGSRSDPGGS